MLHILCMQEHREGSGLIISVLCRIGRGRPACPLEDYCHGYVRIGPVSSKCGEPISREFVGYREVLDEYGFYNEVAVEEWAYGPRNGMYQFLRFEGNRLIKIESKRGK